MATAVSRRPIVHPQADRRGSAVLPAAHRFPQVVHDQWQVHLRRRQVGVTESVLHVAKVGAVASKRL